MLQQIGINAVRESWKSSIHLMFTQNAGFNVIYSENYGTFKGKRIVKCTFWYSLNRTGKIYIFIVLSHYVLLYI